jgi:hypothetical protein
MAGLIQNLKGGQYAMFTGEDSQRPGYDVIDRIIGLRLIILRIRDGLSALNSYPDHAAKVETTFRMGLRWGLKRFSSNGHELRLCSLHFDGYQHYGRRLDLARIRERIGELPRGVSFPNDLTLDDRSSDHRRTECQEYDDCQLLQLVDVLVGGFRTALGHATSEVHYQLCGPLAKLASDLRLGPARMRHSRWNNGFGIREAYIESNRWQFADIVPKPINTQTKLFAAES